MGRGWSWARLRARRSHPADVIDSFAGRYKLLSDLDDDLYAGIVNEQ